MSFNSNDKTVYDLLNDKMFIIAPNQRKYVWKKNNWTEMIEDIDLVFQRKTDRHFIGSIVMKKEKIRDGVRNHLSIIDGQQRISTLTIMLCAIAYIFAENGMNDEFYGLKKPLFVIDNKNNPHPILSENANRNIARIVRHLFDVVDNHFNNGASLPDIQTMLKESANSSNDIKECFVFFYNAFKERIQTDIQILSQYRDIINEICYIDIVAEEDEDAYTIFEVLNARGQALTDFELLRNYLLRYSSDDEKANTKTALKQLEDTLGKDIEIFLKHYVMHKYGEKTDKNENRPYKVIAKHEKNNIKKFITDLSLKSKYYQKMTTFENCTDLEKKVFSFFKPRRQQQFRPLVMGMMHQKELKNLTDSDYDKYLNYLYEFFICYHIIGEQTSNKIEDIVYAYSTKLENQFDKELLETFRKSIAKRIPNEDNFINSIKRIRYSHKYTAYSDNRKRENAFAIYELLERELGYTGSFDDMNIEHCYPDSADEINAHIGNLMILEKSINDKCKQKPLSQKIEFYNESKLKYPKLIREKFLKDGTLDYEKNSIWVAEILYKRIKEVTLVTA